MVNINKNRKSAIFYTCGTCNLNCRYCGINKNAVLSEIDKALAKSFEGDYYFQRVKEYFPRKDMLTEFQTWGGEPFLHMERIHNLLHQLIKYYPYLKEGYSSTNFSFPNWNEKFFGLMDVFAAYPYRDFSYCLQLSVDGPAEINDAGRGEGVTEKCLNNFNALIENLKNHRLADNIFLTITLKGTLDNNTMQILDSKEKIIEYYKFYEDNFIEPIMELNLPNVCILPGIPNTAVPSPVTVAQGKQFAKLVRLCRELEQENETKGYLKYYQYITPYYHGPQYNELTYNYSHYTCGTGDMNVGFLPDNMVSTCHEGFTQMVEEYQKVAAEQPNLASTITFDKFVNEQKVSLCATDEQYAQHEYKMSLYNASNATARLATNATLIVALALAGQIDRKYIHDEEALRAAIFMQNHTSYCIKDNYNKTGSYTLQPVGLFKLLLNGAIDYIDIGDNND